MNMRMPLPFLCFYSQCLIAWISAACGTMLTMHWNETLSPPSSSIYFYRQQLEPAHKFQFDAFFSSLKYRFSIKCSVQASWGKWPFQSKSWSWSWQLKDMYEGTIHLFMHTFNFCCSKQETVQGSTCTLRSQTWQYILHTPNRILFISDLGIIRKCNWVWSCWLIRKIEICPKTILKNSQAWH